METSKVKKTICNKSIRTFKMIHY